MNRTHRIVTVLAVLIAFVTILAGCGGSTSPTEPKPLAATPTSVPSGTPTPGPTPIPGTTPTPTPVPVISISVMSLSPSSGSNVVVGRQVSVKFRVSGFTAGDSIVVQPSEDGVNPSPNGTYTSVAVSSLLTTMFSMQVTGRTVALLFYHYVNDRYTQILGSTYMVTYNWVAPTMVVSIGAGGVFSPRDSGTLPVGTIVTYRNDDTKNHQPNSTNSGMVNCPGMFPGEVCTFTVLNLTGGFIRVSVADLDAPDFTAEAHSFTVNP